MNINYNKLKKIIIILVIIIVVFFLISWLLELLTRKRRAKESCNRFCEAIELFVIDYGRFPTEKEGLRSLFQSSNDPSGKEPYLMRPKGVKLTFLLLDPWKTPYKYKVSDKNVKVISAGPDKKIGTDDDIACNLKRNIIDKYQL